MLQAAEQEVVSQLSVFAKKMKASEELAARNVAEVKKAARDHNSKVRDAREAYMELDYLTDKQIEKTGKSFKRQE